MTVILGGLLLLPCVAVPAAAEMSEPAYQDLLETARECGRAQPRERVCGGEERFPDAVRQSFMEHARQEGAGAGQLEGLDNAWEDGVREATDQLRVMRIACPSPPPEGLSPIAEACGGAE